MYRKILSLILFFAYFFFTVNSSFGQNVSISPLNKNAIKPLDIKFNTKAQQFSPIIYNNGLIYVSNKKTKFNQIGYNKVYWVPFSDFAKYDSVNEQIDIKLNSSFNALLSNDNNLVYKLNRKSLLKVANTIESKFIEFIPEHSFTVNNDLTKIIYTKQSFFKNKGKNHWQLWEADLINGKVEHQQKIRVKENDADYFYPFLTPDGNTLYFSSNVKGGKGGCDLYYMEKVNGTWTNNIINLNLLNSEANEISPVLFNQNIFFASNKDGGYGGYDIYSADSKTNPINLGQPINTKEDDISLVLNEHTRVVLSNIDSNLNFRAYLQETPIKSQLYKNFLIKQDTNFVVGAVPSNSLLNNSSINNVDSASIKQVDSIVNKHNNTTTNAYTNSNTHTISSTFENSNSITGSIVSKANDKNTFNNQIDSLKSLAKDYTVLHHPFNSFKTAKMDLPILYGLINTVKKTHNAKIIVVPAKLTPENLPVNQLLVTKRSNRLVKMLSRLSNNQVTLLTSYENDANIPTLTSLGKLDDDLAERFTYIFIIKQ
jgi:hypothetical protein